MNELQEKKIGKAYDRFDQAILDELNARRPDKYNTRDRYDFRDEAADACAHMIPATYAQKMAARQRARRRERDVVAKVPDLLRELFEARQMPLWWYEELLYKQPVMVTDDERIRFDVASAEDFDRAEVHLRREGMKLSRQYGERADVFQRMAETLRSSGLNRGGQLHDSEEFGVAEDLETAVD